MRLFIAVPLPEQTRDQLSELQRRLKALPLERASWVRRPAMHVTLRFLGGVDEQMVPDICEVLEEALTERAPFETVLKGGGAFPNARRPRVFWVGLEDGGRFAELAHAANLALTALGFQAPEQPFRPHVTLCRVSGPWLGGLPAPLEQLDELGRFQVDRLDLFRSELRPAGAVHTSLHSFPLG